MSKKNKMMASILAMSMVLANVTSMVADAATIPGVDSDFEYELKVTKVSDSRIMVTFYTTTNPGVLELGLAFLYDPDKYNYDGYWVDENLITLMTESNFLCVPEANEETGICVIGNAFNWNKITPEDYTTDFEISIYLEADDGNVDDEGLSEFAVAVKDYRSLTENLVVNRSNSLNQYDPKIAPPEVKVTSNFFYEYCLGDTDGNEMITISDATTINSLVSVVQSIEERNPDDIDQTCLINNLNEKIEDDKTSILSSGESFNWLEQFGDSSKKGNFLRTVNGVTFACVESADANADGCITADDSTAVLEWYSQMSAGAAAKEILQWDHKTVYY